MAGHVPQSLRETSTILNHFVAPTQGGGGNTTWGLGINTADDTNNLMVKPLGTSWSNHPDYKWMDSDFFDMGTTAQSSTTLYAGWYLKIYSGGIQEIIRIDSIGTVGDIFWGGDGYKILNVSRAQLGTNMYNWSGGGATVEIWDDIPDGYEGYVPFSGQLSEEWPSTKKLIQGHPKYTDTSQYNFSIDYSTEPPNHSDSTGLPIENDKFQSKDLYTKTIGSKINEVIIERNLKAEADSFIRVDELYIARTDSRESKHNKVEGFLFSHETLNPIGIDYYTLKASLTNEMKFFSQAFGDRDRDLGNMTNLEGNNILFNLTSGPDLGEFNFNNDNFGGGNLQNFKSSLELIEPVLTQDTLNTQVFDENQFNPIYFCFRLKGNKDPWIGTDVRKTRYMVYRIDNESLFNYSGNTATGKHTEFTLDNLQKVADVSGDGGGWGVESPAHTVQTLRITINTSEQGINSWAPSSDMDNYTQYFAEIRAPYELSRLNMVDVDLLNIAPDRQLSNRANSGNDFSLENQDITADDGYFPDYFPLTTFNVFNVDGTLNTDIDLQNYYEKDIEKLFKASVPATIGLNFMLVSPALQAANNRSFFAFVIDWNDKDDEIKTIEDWLDKRPVSIEELKTLQEKQNTYKIVNNIEVQDDNTAIVTEFEIQRITHDIDGEIEQESVIEKPVTAPNPQEGGFITFEGTIDGVNDGTYEVLNIINQESFVISGYLTYQGSPGGTATQTTIESQNPDFGHMFDSDIDFLSHTYSTPGIKTIKSIMITYDPFSNQLGRWKLITSRIFLDIPINQYPDFLAVGGNEYTTLPWPYTTPIIGGVSEDSKYKKSVRGTLSGGQISDVDIIDERFLVNDRDNDEMGKSVDKMDLEQCRYFNTSYDMYSLLNIEFAGVINYIEYNTDDLFLQTLEGYNGQGMSDYELGLLYPGQWINYGRPDIAAYIQSINPADESDDNTDTQNQVMGGTSTGGSDGSILDDPIFDGETPGNQWSPEIGQELFGGNEGGTYNPPELKVYAPVNGEKFQADDESMGFIDIKWEERYIYSDSVNIQLLKKENGTLYTVALIAAATEGVHIGTNKRRFRAYLGQINEDSEGAGIMFDPPPGDNYTIGVFRNGTPALGAYMGGMLSNDLEYNIDNIATFRIVAPQEETPLVPGEDIIITDTPIIESAFSADPEGTMNRPLSTFANPSGETVMINTTTPYTENGYQISSYWDGFVNKFPMESSVGQIFISDNQDIDLKQNCKLELNTAELSGKTIIDSSGNSNKGILIGDYKVKKTKKGEPMRRDSFIKVPKKTGNTKGAL